MRKPVPASWTRSRAAACLCLAALLRAAACAGEPAKPSPRWFGASGEDFQRARELHGVPLKVKARFVRVLEYVKEGVRARDETVLFLVEAEAGRIACAMCCDAKNAEALCGMKYATPLVVLGTVDAGRRVFVVRSIDQGWGRSQLGDG